MTFALDQDPTPSEVSDAINYLLANLTSGFTTNQQTGQVFGPGGSVTSYLYKYLSVKYADSYDGTVNFVNTPTNRLYYGLRNSDSSTESTNPADYVWYKVTGGFSTNKFLYYTVTGGRRIDLIVAMAAPSALWQPDSGTAIDLDVISSADGASSRICYAKSTSFALSSIPSTYQTSGKSSFPPYNTWGGSETWQATPPTLGVNEALFQSDGIYNPLTDLTTWNAPYLSNLKVGALSAITANLGSITAGSLDAVSITGSQLTVGSSPAISGTTMTGSGAKIYTNGSFVLGNSTANIVFNGTNAYINGFTQGGSSSFVSASVPSSGDVTIGTFTVSQNGIILVSMSGAMSMQTSTSASGAIWGVDVYIKNNSGTVVSNTNNSFSSYGVPIYLTPSASVKSIGVPVSYFIAVSLSAGTYTLRAARIPACYALDSTGNVISGGVSNVGIGGGYLTTYQVLA